MALKLTNNKLEGYVAVWDSPSLNIPGVGTEVVKRGAFSKAIASGRNIRALDAHDKGKPLGSIKAGTLQVKEDDTGLFVSIDLPDTAIARDIKTLAARGEEFGGSFGAINGKYKPTKDGRELTELDLMEISVTALPAYEATLSRSIDNLIKENHMGIENTKETVVDATVPTIEKTEVKVIERTMETKSPELKPLVNPVIGLSQKEKEQYSILRAVRMIKDGKKLDGIEGECHEEIQRQVGASPKGNFYLPAAELQYAATRSAVNSTTFAGALTTQWTDFVTVLRNKLAFSAAGGRVIEGLVGTVKIPKQTATGSVYWVGEGSDVTESEPTATSSITFSNKTMGTWSKIERSQYLQTSYSVEQFVRDDILANMALGIDAACFSGTGTSNQPKGFLYDTAIQRYNTYTSWNNTLAYTDLVAMESYVADLNNDLNSGNFSFVTTPKVRGKLKVTQKVGSTFPNAIWGDDNKLLGYNTVVTNQVKSTADEYNTTVHNMVFGDFSQAILGTWTAIDVQVDTITYGSSGAVKLIALTDLDFHPRRTDSFIVAENITVS